ncbi:MAG: gliding motility-associated C-terminal domain-containing protein, partial [Candidatus Latescibacteria bacterium]|nr:gliding motility-associated C-terminal domain-containing protein [Candidatus Latescibacterota bacterium]
DSIIAWTDSTLLIKYPHVIINQSLIPPNRFALILDPEYTMVNPSGGEIQPYNLPDSLIILTVGNTTIGNELQTNDPLLLYSFEGDSSSFGTPFNANDSFPYDVGDGISWERKSPALVDLPEHWIASLDASGSTPGRANSVLSYYDLAIINICTKPAGVLPNSSDTIGVVVKNVGYQPAYYWHVLVFNDKNRNNIEDTGERLYYTFGLGLTVEQETTVSFVWESIPAGEHKIWAIVNFPDDINLDNNRLSKIISTSAKTGDFGLVKNIFSPDGDGVDDSLFFYYNFTEPNGKLTLLVYDLNGKLIRKLADKQTASPTGIFAWDGKNDKNQNAPIGIYVVYLEYKTNTKTMREKTSAVLVKKI